MTDFTWGEKLSCLATYKVLESDKMLDQFEDADVPFGKAGSLKVKRLRSFLHTTTTHHVLEAAALQLAHDFVYYLDKFYVVRKEAGVRNTAEIIRSLAAVFTDGDSTLTDLARVADQYIHFEDEA
jgi:hypothetical protein